MFTGIVQQTGSLAVRETTEGDARLGIDVPAPLADRLGPGDSVSVNGVCLTVAGSENGRLLFDVSAETLSKTHLGGLDTGARLNLEPALAASDPLGGHFVTGHVDGVGKVSGLEADGRSHRVEIQAPESLMRYIAVKGCITVDGISLTVNSIDGNRFGVNLVPHTWSETNAQNWAVGAHVNLEVDLIARYLERLAGDRDAPPVEHDITADFLSRQGFTPPVMEDEAGAPVDHEEPADDSAVGPGT